MVLLALPLLKSYCLYIFQLFSGGYDYSKAIIGGSDVKFFLMNKKLLINLSYIYIV